MWKIDKIFGHPSPYINPKPVFWDIPNTIPSIDVDVVECDEAQKTLELSDVRKIVKEFGEKITKKEFIAWCEAHKEII